MKKKSFVLVLVIVLLTVIFGTVYVANQQSLRTAANSPQIQIAEDLAASLDNGLKPSSITTRVNINGSLAPFVIIYDKSGNVVGGSGYLSGQLPTVPIGVLKSSDGKQFSSVTWQPNDKIRIASVSVSAKNYYVLSGRSLFEVEKQIQTQGEIVFFGWFVSIVIVLLGMYGLKSSYIKKN